MKYKTKYTFGTSSVRKKSEFLDNSFWSKKREFQCKCCGFHASLWSIKRRILWMVSVRYNLVLFLFLYFMFTPPPAPVFYLLLFFSLQSWFWGFFLPPPPYHSAPHQSPFFQSTADGRQRLQVLRSEVATLEVCVNFLGFFLLYWYYHIYWEFGGYFVEMCTVFLRLYFYLEQTERRRSPSRDKELDDAVKRIRDRQSSSTRGGWLELFISGIMKTILIKGEYYIKHEIFMLNYYFSYHVNRLFFLF